MSSKLVAIHTLDVTRLKLFPVTHINKKLSLTERTAQSRPYVSSLHQRKYF